MTALMELSVLNEILWTHELCVACNLCCRKSTEITYFTISRDHQCSGDVLLARQKGSTSTGLWRPISQRPEFPSPQTYLVCWHFVDGMGCTKHGHRCSFARSAEEAAVWNFQKRSSLDLYLLKSLIGQMQFPNHRAQVRPLSAEEKILLRFPGAFYELCKLCFYSCPPIANIKGHCRNGHPWNPLLVFYQEHERGAVEFSEIRPFPSSSFSSYLYCCYVERGEPCWHGHERCRFAHSIVEMAVWTAESQEGLNRPELLWLSQKQQAGASQQVATCSPQQKFYCKVCRREFSSEESFMNHCASLDHERMICEDVTTEWKYRPPPVNINLVFQLCDSPSPCMYGDNCIQAHSVEELHEWRMRDRTARRKAKAAEEEGLLSYQECLLREYRNSLNAVLIMSETVPGVAVSCDKDLTVLHQRDPLPLKWTFKIQSERPLVEVALLKQDPGATFSLNEITPDGPCTYSRGERFCTSEMSYDVTVSFKPFHPGFYEQWVVFDFDMRPVLLQKLEVRVGEQGSICPEWIKEVVTPPVQSLERWHQGNRVIIPCLNKREAEENLRKEYKPPQVNLLFNPRSEGNIPITIQNYRERMHHFLYTEELAQEEVVSRLSLKVTIALFAKLTDCEFERTAPRGALFAAVPVPYVLTPDTPEGFILKREVRSALVAPPSEAHQSQNVYEAIILPDVIDKDRMFLQLSKNCCAKLDLKNNTTCAMEVQFQLNRQQFCVMHKTIDLLPDVEWVLPDLKKCCVPVHTGEYPRLNAKQQAAIAFIVGDPDNMKPVAPLLIYGPFGTGKTYTLATVVKELVQQLGTKVLICAHTNSSADLYVKDYFHHYVFSGCSEARPLRIKTNKKHLRVTDRITLKYCNLSPDKKTQAFVFPDITTLNKFKVVITTTSTARLFHNLNLPAGYFTHILIDEASQMLECEALIPLTLAGEGTRVVLAGDHMQMGPKLFSVDEDRRSNHTLLNRLFHYYQAAEDQSVASRSRIIFNENYRSTKDIVDFVSTHFYVGKSDAIKACGNVPPHPQCHPLRFHHIQGACHVDTSTLSWYNLEEVACVAAIVQKLIKEWPSQWGNQEPRTICVLSEGMQVFQIRKKLYELKLGAVTVENSQNVQGKQFRAVVMSTIHTRESLRTCDIACLEFFNDPRVMNTVMTRAQSQVIVVGDAAALCSFGKCSRIWKSYIEECIKKKSAEPQHLTEDYIEHEVRETKRFTKEEDNDDDSSDTESSPPEISDIDDPILKELLDESNDIRVTVTSEGLLSIFREDHSSEKTEFYSQKEEPHQDFPAPDLQKLLMTSPNNYKICDLVMKRYDLGYARPLDQPTLCININGRKNVGHSFPGDQVVVEIDKQSSPLSGRVKEVLKRAGSDLFVCTIDDYDPQVMVPINNCVSKIYTPFWKDKPNHIAVRNIENERLRPERFVKINEETKRNDLFVVRVLTWRERFRNPLGIVVDVLPKVATLEGGLEVLDIEYQLRRVLPSSVQEELKKYKDFNLNGKWRKDCREYITFTIDPVNSEDMDDAISVRDLGQHYEVGVHIADIAGFVNKDNPIDKYAQQQGTTFYRPEKEPVHMFPKDLSTEFFSLLPGHDRQAISLMVEVHKKTGRILRREFALSVIRSDRKMSYEEAEKIIQKRCKGKQSCDTLEGCLAVALHFSEVHRKRRMQEDWCYKRPDEDVNIGEGRSHKMIEELMIMFNHAVSEHLITIEATKSLTPVRCQDEPEPEKMRQLKDKYSSLIPLSIHLSYHFDQTGHLDINQELIGSGRDQRSITKTKTVTEHRYHEVTPASDTFCVFTSLIKTLESAAESQDIYKMVDLITTDDIHPQLLPVVTELRKLFQKADIIRSNSVTNSKIGHCDLRLESYTWASSPIRRYIDIIVQRLLHSVLENTDIKYTTKEIDRLCADFSQKYAKQREYEKKVQSLRLASQLRQQSTGKVAFIIDVASSGMGFNLSFPLNSNSLPHMLSIMYRHLQLTDQPGYDEESHCMTLKWRRRVYSFTNGKIHSELKKHQSDLLITPVLRDTWKDILSALRVGKWKTVCNSIQKVSSSITKDSNKQSNESNREWQIVPRNTDKVTKPEPEHYVELSLELKVGETLQVQLGTDTWRGLLAPVVQLVNIHPKFEICLEHVKNPTVCFSKYAVRTSKKQYIDYMEYQKIWKPLCEMESASNAAAENDSIVLEDVTVTWKSKSKDTYLNGFFQLPLEKKKQWSIECDLLNCFLCIRLRDIKQTGTNTPEGPSDLVDTKRFTWVAHGVTTNVIEEEQSEQLSYLQIEFRLNQLSMENIPDIRRNTKLTVELIPKLLPDVRKETAIINLAQANQLVKDIALGKRPHSRSGTAGYGQKMWNVESLGFPPLNTSQREAIKKALDSPFTLIQGPPGTGKTVVGVHIVFLFVMRNKQVLTSVASNDHNGEKKKDGCILYCGPSNKSVDVVAEHLVKLKEELKPLRIYSEQMEMREFPYPGSHLKLSRKALREEKPNQAIRSITLHHLIRAPGKPRANQIRAFDARIRKREELPDEEIERYKKLLNEARQLELVKHHVILCTCTAASNPNITKMLNLQQIIIDECAMATEPEAFIPLVSHKPKQIVLLGDHKQLQPIVHCDLVKRLGMRNSLFERYMDKALMLDTQYRMHKSICEFPSVEFYNGRLKTGAEREPSVLLTKSRQPTPLVFGHVKGKENSLLVSTEKGNENSKANIEEAEQSVRIAGLLISLAEVNPSSIAILTPYNAQVAKINEILSQRHIRDVNVSTIMKSQGSEWRYVILSTVRSCPSSEIDTEPTKAWLTKHLGFIMDPNQVNVGLTRAQEGLCIIGNKDLLSCSALWKRLLKHYQEKKCVMDSAKDIQVQKPGAKKSKRSSKSKS